MSFFVLLNTKQDILRCVQRKKENIQVWYMFCNNMRVGKS